jgi:hypothetical protein
MSQFSANIGDFSNVSDYLPILNAVLITDMLVILLLVTGIIKSNVLKDWYDKYNLSAVICDVLIIVIGIIITRFIYSYIFNKFSLVKFIILAVLVQILHDIIFYFIFTSIPENTNKMLDTFRAYAEEVGAKAIFADSGMVICACLLATLFANKSLNANIITLIGSSYLLPYLIYNN